MEEYLKDAIESGTKEMFAQRRCSSANRSCKSARFKVMVESGRMYVRLGDVSSDRPSVNSMTKR